MRDEFQKIPIPAELDQVVEKSMNCIYKEHKKKKMKKIVVGCSAVAAAFTGGIFFCMNNPVLASNLPLIGHIFEKMQDTFGYAGDYSQVGERLEDESVALQLETASDAEEMEQISQYTQTSDGLTVTLSEIYCNDQAIYVTVQMKAEEKIPEIWGFQCETTEQYSFNPTEQLDVPVIDGKMVDEYTYAGVMRFDLNQKIIDMSEYNAAREKAIAAGEEWDDSWSAYGTNDNYDKYVKTVEVPDEFTLELTIDEMYAPLENPDIPDYGKTEEELNAMSDEEWKEFMNNWMAENPDWAEFHSEHTYAIFKGPWKFTIDVSKNTDDTQIVELHDVNEKGIGMEKVVKDRFEITMYDTYTNDAVSVDYFPVMLDADGRLMEYGSGGSVNTVAVGDRDVSRVDIFLVDYFKWMDELKGAKWQEPGALTEDGRTFKELLMDECAYHTEVVFEEN